MSSARLHALTPPCSPAGDCPAASSGCTSGSFRGDRLLDGTTFVAGDGAAPPALMPRTEAPSTPSFHTIYTITPRHGKIVSGQRGIPAGRGWRASQLINHAGQFCSGRRTQCPVHCLAWGNRWWSAGRFRRRSGTREAGRRASGRAVGGAECCGPSWAGRHSYAQLVALAGDPPVPQPVVLLGQPDDEVDDLGVQPPAGPGVRIGPAAPDQARCQRSRVLGVTRNAAHRSRGSSRVRPARMSRSVGR